jgi:hypothetical protein
MSRLKLPPDQIVVGNVRLLDSTMASTLIRGAIAHAKVCRHVAARALSTNVPATLAKKKVVDIYASTAPQQSTGFVQRMKNGKQAIVRRPSCGIIPAIATLRKSNTA